jgi:hypothetical protein
MKNSERSFARRIDLTSLQLFVAVCELGSIGRAAEREFIAASAVSKRLSDLEATVDTALLYRHSRGVTLTPAGESLLHHARNVLYGLERMQGELSEYADGVRGHVRMHANMSAIVQFLPEDLGAFAREHSQIKIDLQEHLSPDVLSAVAEGTADIGICTLGNIRSSEGNQATVQLTQGNVPLQYRSYRKTDWSSSCPSAMPWPSAKAWPSPKCWNGTSSACMRAPPSAWPCALPRPRPATRCTSASRSPAWTPCAA